LIINVFSLIMAGIGSFGVLTLRKWFITAHAMITLAIFGSVCAYSVIESFFNENNDVNVSFYLIKLIFLRFRYFYEKSSFLRFFEKSKKSFVI